MLTKKNKRMVRKMKKYIKTFPLTEKEIDQMIEDISYYNAKNFFKF